MVKGLTSLPRHHKREVAQIVGTAGNGRRKGMPGKRSMFSIEVADAIASAWLMIAGAAFGGFLFVLGVEKIERWLSK